MARFAVVFGTRLLVWSYAVGILATLLIVEWSTDSWWPTTLLAFGPKWIGLCPLLLLLPFTLFLRARLLPLLLSTGAAYAIFVMGFNLPYPWQKSETRQQEGICLMTCNMGGTKDWNSINRLIVQNSVDIVALQEVMDSTPKLPKNWNWKKEGKLVIASRYPVVRTRKWIRLDPPQQWPPLIAMHSAIELPGQDLNVCNVHLTSPHHGLAALLDRKQIVDSSRKGLLVKLIALREQESKSLRSWINEIPQTDVIIGDFNMPTNSQIYRRYWKDFTNSFSQTSWGFGHTRTVSIRKITFGARIDHILTNDEWGPIDCRIGPDVGSDHLPVLAEIARIDSE